MKPENSSAVVYIITNASRHTWWHVRHVLLVSIFGPLEQFILTHPPTVNWQKERNQHFPPSHTRCTHNTWSEKKTDWLQSPQICSNVPHVNRQKKSCIRLTIFNITSKWFKAKRRSNSCLWRETENVSLQVTDQTEWCFRASSSENFNL